MVVAKQSISLIFTMLYYSYYHGCVDISYVTFIP